MIDSLQLAIKSITIALETQKDTYIIDINKVDTHVMYLSGQINAYKNVSKLISDLKEMSNA